MVFWFCQNKAEPNWKIVSKTRTKPKPDDFLNSELNPTQNPTQTEPNIKKLEPVATLIETLRQNIKTKKEEKRKLTEKYELALKKFNFMEEEFKNERLIYKENYEKQINEISKQIEKQDLQLKKFEHKKLNDETIPKKRQERESKDEYFQKTKRSWAIEV